MAVIAQKITDKYAIYNGDCIEVMGTLPDKSVHLSIYSPPFCGVYHYSSSEHDLSNCSSYEQFFEHYRYFVKELFRLTVPGRMTAVHCMDILASNTGKGDYLVDFSGDLIRLYNEEGWKFVARYTIWKEPLKVRNKTMAKCLHHATIVKDSSKCGVALADYVVIFRKKGDNPVPVIHPNGLMEYAGSRNVPKHLLRYKGWTGSQLENQYSHWIWRQYASCMWDDIRFNRILPYKFSRDPDDEKHVHPLQLDVIDRIITLWSNEGETVLTPFMGVGSEVYGAITAGRRGIGIELKSSYYHQAVKNMEVRQEDQMEMFNDDEEVN